MEAFTLDTPADIDGAVAAIQGNAGAKFIAGGTDLMQLMKDFVERPKQLVDIDRLPLGKIEIGDDGARIGALVRMSTAGDHPELHRRYPVMVEALLASASPQVRNLATMGGNLLQRTRCGYFRDAGSPCNKREPGTGCPAQTGDHRRLAVLGVSDKCIASHPSDLAVALAALDAAVELRGPGGGTRTVPLNEFYRLPGDTPQYETVMTPGELITGILLPQPEPGQRSHYLKVRDRAEFEFAVVSAAVVVNRVDGRIQRARIALGGVGTKPWRVPQVEAALAGAPLTAEAVATAAVHAADGAHPFPENAFKIPLMQRALTRAVLTAVA